MILALSLAAPLGHARSAIFLEDDEDPRLEEPIGKEDLDLVIVGWLDHFTYGAFNTAVGLPTAILGSIINGIRYKDPLVVQLNPTGQMIKLPNASISGYNYATGAIQHGSGSDYHEPGHGKQSAILGPAFLPLVGITYLIQGFDRGVMESWASTWALLGRSLVNRRVQTIDVEVRSSNGRTSTRLGFNFVALERSSRVDAHYAKKTNPTAVALRYGRIALFVLMPTAGAKAEQTSSLAEVQAALIERDFYARWTIAGGFFSFLVDAQQTTGGVKWDLADARVRAQLLSHTLGMGARLGREDRLALDVVGRASAGVEGVWQAGQRDPSQPPGLLRPAYKGGIYVLGGVGGEARLHVLEYAQLYFRKMLYWGDSGYRRDVETAGAESPLYFRSNAYTLRNGKSKFKKFNSPDGPTNFFGGVKLERDVETYPAATGRMGKNDVKMLLFTFGGRW